MKKKSKYRAGARPPVTTNVAPDAHDAPQPAHEEQLPLLGADEVPDDRVLDASSVAPEFAAALMESAAAGDEDGLLVDSADPLTDPSLVSPVVEAAPIPAPEPIVASEVPEFASAPSVVHTEGPSLGARMKRSREAQGLAVEHVARQLRIPAARIVELEADAYDRISAPIYLRGYLKSYARLLGMPEVVVTHALDSLRKHDQPALVATQTVSRSRYMASRYGTPLVYAVVTAVVIVPVLWAAYEGSLLPAAKPRLEPLDTAGLEIARPVAPAIVEAPAGASDALAGPPEAAFAAVPEPVAEERRPVMAAMTPMPSTPAYAEPAPAPAPAASTQGQQVVLTLEQASWVELIDATGKRIEYGLLPAGTTRTYTIAGTANLRIGNTRGAKLTIDGQATDLAPHTRSNVARVVIGKPVESAANTR